MQTILLYSQPEFEAARLRAVAKISNPQFSAESTLTDEHIRTLFESLFKAAPAVLWEYGQFPIIYTTDGVPEREEIWGVKSADCSKPCKRQVALTNGTVMELIGWPDYADLLTITL